MSRIIRRIDCRVRANQLGNIALPECPIKLSKDFKEMQETFTARFISTEKEDSTAIKFVPATGVLEASRYSVTVHVSEETLGNVLSEVARSNFCTIGNSAMINFIMCNLLSGVSQLLKEDEYYYFDVTSSKWI